MHALPALLASTETFPLWALSAAPVAPRGGSPLGTSPRARFACGWRTLCTARRGPALGSPSCVASLVLVLGPQDCPPGTFSGSAAGTCTYKKKGALIGRVSLAPPAPRPHRLRWPAPLWGPALLSPPPSPPPTHLTQAQTALWARPRAPTTRHPAPRVERESTPTPLAKQRVLCVHPAHTLPALQLHAPPVPWGCMRRPQVRCCLLRVAGLGRLTWGLGRPPFALARVRPQGFAWLPQPGRHPAPRTPYRRPACPPPPSSP